MKLREALAELERLRRRDERVRAMLDEAIALLEAGEPVDVDALRIIRAQMDAES